MALWVDERWSGTYGIARFAKNVTSRLDRDYMKFSPALSPTSPRDWVSTERRRLPARDLLFTPGFNAGPASIRQLVTVHDLIHLDARGPTSIAMRAYYDLVLKPQVVRTKMVLTVSETSARAIERWLGDAKVDVRVVGNGVDERFLRPGNVADLPRTAFVFVGNMKAHKNPATVFAALALRPKYTLEVVTPDGEHAHTLAARYGVEHQVSVLTGVSDDVLAEMYQTRTGLVFPSRLEGFGLPVVEAIACGMPVAYWEGCHSVAELVPADGGIAVARLTDPQAWAAAMDALATVGRVAPRADWLSDLSWSAVAGRVGKAIDDLG